MKKPTRRCALYTRKSSEEGLGQEFNSLDAQREACDAYVRSQSGEGWKVLPKRYDDGGFSGGSMERPALQRLLGDIRAGRIDIVVVYKIDRLTRSLADFARMVEVFEAHEVSFVSVTQAFNTTSSMGRLTLNVLLSFAQFEREVTGERIRDKIAASKKKGMWMGGNVPLGYDRPTTGTHSLRLNTEEAATVRHIFRTYRDLGSVYELERYLREAGISSKLSFTREGKAVGGRPFSRGALFHLLRNRVYLGEITHRDQSYPGLHEQIVDPDLFDEVQDMLNANATRRRSSSESVAASPLAGRIFDADGQVISPTFAYGKAGRLYRYYVSATLQQGQRCKDAADAPRRVSAPRVEGTLTEVLQRLVPNGPNSPLELIARVEVRAQKVLLLLPVAHLAELRGRIGAGETAEADPTDRTLCRVILPLRFAIRGGKTEAVGGTPGEARPDPVLIKALRAAHDIVCTDRTGAPTLNASPETPHRRKLVRLAFLAPDIQRAILTGNQPRDLSLARILERDLPLLWNEQREMFGFARNARSA